MTGIWKVFRRLNKRTDHIILAQFKTVAIKNGFQIIFRALVFLESENTFNLVASSFFILKMQVSKKSITEKENIIILVQIWKGFAFSIIRNHL